VVIILFTESKIFTGNKFIFGYNVTPIDGNHKFTNIGSSVFDVEDKKPELEDDLDF
jgi:hypothetical protein